MHMKAATANASLAIADSSVGTGCDVEGRRGLRRGEKFYEELVGNQESVEPSGVEKINKLSGDRPLDAADIDRHLAELRRCVAAEHLGSRQCFCDALAVLQELVPTFTPEPQTVQASTHRSEPVAHAG